MTNKHRYPPRAVGKKKVVKPEVMKFVPVEKVFKPMVKVRARADITGSADPGDPNSATRFRFRAGTVRMIDADTAAVWAVKGYVDIVGGETPEISEDQLAELTKNDAKIGL